MTPRLFLVAVTFVFFVATFVVACGQVPNKSAANKNHLSQSTNLKLDSSKTTIIEFDKKGNWLFDSSFDPATLTQMELEVVDSFLLACVTNYNTSLDKDHKQWGIDLKKRNYRKQLVVVINKKSEKEVWVNCFCSSHDFPWKTKIYLVDDGGNCFFNFKINLTRNTYYNLIVNGVA